MLNRGQVYSRSLYYVYSKYGGGGGDFRVFDLWQRWSLNTETLNRGLTEQVKILLLLSFLEINKHAYPVYDFRPCKDTPLKTKKKKLQKKKILYPINYILSERTSPLRSNEGRQVT